MPVAKGIKELAEVIAKGADRALDMSHSARMGRARDMGFDTDRVWYHGTDADITAFDPDKLGLTTGAQSARKGFFFASNPEMAAAYPQYPQELLMDYGGFSKKPGESIDSFRKRTGAESIFAKADKASDEFARASSSLHEAAANAGLGKEYRAAFISDPAAIVGPNGFDYLPVEQGIKAQREARERIVNAGLGDKVKDYERALSLKSTADSAAEEYSTAMDWSKQAWAGGSEDGTWGAAKESLSPNIMQLRSRLKDEDLLIHDFGGKPYREVSYADLLESAATEGKKGALFKNTADPTPGDVLVVFDPSSVRSINASFNPAEKESANLLASAAPVAAGLGAMSPGEQAQAAMLGRQPSPGMAEPTGDAIPIRGNPKLIELAKVLEKYSQTPLGPALGGIAGALNKIGWGEKLKPMDYVNATLDFL